MNKNTLKILLVEDNSADSKLVSIFLKGIYYVTPVINIANSLNAAIELAEITPYDIIILDLSLPDSQGIETFSKLHAKIPAIPIIVLTGSEDEKLGTESVKMGAQDFLTKGNIDENTLKRSINYSIERNKTMQALSEKTASLLAEKQKLAEAQKLAHIGSWEWDLLSNQVIWSDEFYVIHGLVPGEELFTAESMMKYIHPADRESLKQKTNSMIATRKETNFIYRIVRKDGSLRTILAIGNTTFNERDELVKVIGTGQDITDRTHEEEMEKLATAATKSFNAVTIIDSEGKIEWVNEGYTALTGYTLDEVKGTLISKEENTGFAENKVYLENVLRDRKPLTFESRNHSKNGEKYWTITTLTPVIGAKGEVERIIAIDSDITLRKQMEEKILEASQEAKNSLRIREQFLANMSHEIRTPMNAIVGFTGLVLKTSLTPEQKKYLNVIKTSGQNLLVIINDILDFSKIQSGKVHFEQTGFNLHKIISSVIELMLPRSLEKQINLITVNDPGIPEYLVGDPTRLAQILNNLIGNAIKFTERGIIKLTTLVTKKSKGNIEITFSVSDTGIGIPEDKLNSIFDYFTQASPETTRKYGGTGLGLTIVKELVEQQGGSIRVKSKLNEGAEFTFNLPFCTEKETPHPFTNTQEPVYSSACSEKLNILLVEDNDFNVMLAEKVLKDWQWKVDIAKDAFIALDKIQKKNYDLVLMDIQLPDMDGYEATRKIRSDFPGDKKNIPIIAMTAHALRGEEEKCLEAGMNGYISKPFDPKNLYTKIVSTLDAKQG